VDEATPSETVDRVRRACEFWNSGTPELMLSLCAEDAELDLSAVSTDLGVCRGRDGMRRQLDALWENWEGVRLDPLAVFDIGAGRLVVDLRWWGRAKRSGVEMDQRAALLCTFRAPDDKIVRSRLFLSVEAAMDSATESAQVARTA
jgi:ketosteroid isomerase-like protein